MELSGAVALVTGSSSGIGAAVASSLARHGAHVVVNSRSSVQEGERVAAELGGSYRQADVADPGAARALVADVVAAHGRLDVLVNNAGTTEVIDHADLASATPEVWMRLYATNVVAPWVLTAAAAPTLAASPRGSGCVVNIGSLAGLRPVGSSIPYAAQGCPAPPEPVAGGHARPGRAGQRRRPWPGAYPLDRGLVRHPGLRRGDGADGP